MAKITREAAKKEVIEALIGVCQINLVEGCGDIESARLGMVCKGSTNRSTGTVIAARGDSADTATYEEFKFKYKIIIELE